MLSLAFGGLQFVLIQFLGEIHLMYSLDDFRCNLFLLIQTPLLPNLHDLLDGTEIFRIENVDSYEVKSLSDETMKANTSEMIFNLHPMDLVDHLNS